MKKLIVLLLLLGSILGIGVSKYLGDSNDIEVTIINKTGTDLNKLYLTYNAISSDIRVPQVEAHSERFIEITPTEEFGENSMELYYDDANGDTHRVTVIGYFEKGYHVESTITIKTVDEDGILKVDVEENIYY